MERVRPGGSIPEPWRFTVSGSPPTVNPYEYGFSTVPDGGPSMIVAGTPT
ncbi:MAG: hypothetical protein WKH64_06490 [Chloroflexia bacterium]